MINNEINVNVILLYSRCRFSEPMCTPTEAATTKSIYNNKNDDDNDGFVVKRKKNKACNKRLAHRTAIQHSHFILGHDLIARRFVCNHIYIHMAHGQPRSYIRSFSSAQSYVLHDSHPFAGTRYSTI